MTFAEAVAKRTKELLIEKKMTMYRLIKITCLDKTTIQGIMKAKNKDLKLSTLFLIADAFGMTISEFTDKPYFTREFIEI